MGWYFITQNITIQEHKLLVGQDNFAAVQWSDFCKKNKYIFCGRMESFMEKKTMGQFLSILRKNAGMTQKDLAEKLNVSDKAISRWERDENAPDINLLPIIADIFGVTCDELLRGEYKLIEKKESDYREDNSKGNNSKENDSKENENAPGQDKVVKLKGNDSSEIVSAFTIKNLIAIGITALCPISIKICDECDLGIGLAYSIGAIFILFGILSEIAFYKAAAAKLLNADFGSVDEGNRTRFCLMKQFQNALLIQASIIMGSMYITEGQEEFIYLTIIQIIFTIIVGKIIIGVVNKKLSRKSIIMLSEKEKMRESLKFKMVLILVAILATTGIAQLMVEIVLEPRYFCDTYEIDSFEDFKEIEYLHYADLECYTTKGKALTLHVYCGVGGELEEYSKEELGDNFPMVVCRYEDLRYGKDIIQNIHNVFMALYLVEVIVFLFYARWNYKRKMAGYDLHPKTQK